jgi:hypothetical protein
MKRTHSEQMIEMIAMSDLPTPAKIYALGKLREDSYCNQLDQIDSLMLGYLVDFMPQNGDSIRVKDLIAQNDLPFSTQKITALLQKCVYYGKVKRTTQPTGRTIVVQYGYYEYGKNYRPIWIEKEKEIDEVIALYSIRK